MKKIYIIISLIALFSFAAAKEIVLQYDIAPPQVVRIKGTDYYRLIMKDAGERGEIGEPALPWLVVKALLPPDEVAVTAELVLSGEEIMKPEGKLYPVQSVQPVSQINKSDFVINLDSYRADAPLPEINNGNLLTEAWHGYNIALSSFCPVSYNPATGNLSYYSKAILKITTEFGSVNRVQKSVQYLSNKNAALVNNFVDNPKMLRNYPRPINREGEYDLLVIAAAEFMEILTPLRDFYHLFGRRVKFVTVEYVAENLNGFDLAEQIRNHIIDEYSSYGIESVLLAGDVEHIPARGFWCSVQSSQIYEDDNIPADLYYSALDGSWDDDGDGLWGEPGEDDLLPEVAVARLPFSNDEELINMINKMQAYSLMPVIDELNKPALVGETLWLDPITYGADYLDLLVGFHDENGYATQGIPETDNISFLYDRDANWAKSDFLSLVNDGTSFIHHVGHSNYSYMIRMHSEDIIEENFELVDGIIHNFPLLYTHGCNCGGFDQDDCIAEDALKLPLFITGFIGNSRYGWFNEGQTEGPSQHLHREFLNALYEYKINDIARTHLMSKIATAPWVTAPGQHEEGALRWCFYDCNVLAEPILPIWTAQPEAFTVNYPAEININTNTVNIYVEMMHGSNPAPNFRLLLRQQDEIIGSGITDSLGTCELIIDSLINSQDDLTLAVSGYNCLPQEYCISISASGSSQNQVPPSKHFLMNFPNPFNPETEISFYLENPENITLTIYSIKGRQVLTLIDKYMNKGMQVIKWDGKDTSGRLVNSGIYFARLTTEHSNEEIKMLLLK